MRKKNFNELSWLRKHRYNIKMSKRKLNTIMSFSLIWNVFEHYYFDRSNELNPDRLIELAKLSYEFINSEQYLQFIHHFRNRYIEDKENGEKRFDKLQLREIDKTLVINTLTDCSPPENYLTALFLISHRFRNNLFHGNKAPITLHIYEKQFKTINKFLTKFIDDTINNSDIIRDRFH